MRILVMHRDPAVACLWLWGYAWRCTGLSFLHSDDTFIKVRGGIPLLTPENEVQMACYDIADAVWEKKYRLVRRSRTILAARRKESNDAEDWANKSQDLVESYDSKTRDNNKTFNVEQIVPCMG